MQIENNIIRRYLRNVYFITGTAYAGKSTAARLLSERYGLTLCGENYFTEISDKVAEPEIQPDLCYLRDLRDFRDFVTRTPEEYERWIYNTGREAAGFEAAELISLSRGGKVIVDTNMPLDILHDITDYDHVAVMLSPQSLSVDRFFDRSDPEKQFILSVIESCPDPEAVMENYRRGLALINSQAHYDEYAESGFFTLVREDDGTDTRDAVCEKLAEHFGFKREQLERIAHYEDIMQRAQNMSDNDPARKQLIEELSAYYGSTAWKCDFAADEAGRLPKDLRRGVLSEDRIYNMLSDTY